MRWLNMVSADNNALLSLKISCSLFLVLCILGDGLNSNNQFVMLGQLTFITVKLN